MPIDPNPIDWQNDLAGATPMSADNLDRPTLRQIADVDARIAIQAATDAIAYTVKVMPAIDYARAALASSALRPVYVVITGDSYIEGSDATTAAKRFVNLLAARMQAAYPSTTQKESDVARLEAAYAAPITTPGVHVLNGGVGATDSANYLTTTSIGYINAVAPKIVIHVIGTNDLATERAVASYKANLIAKMAAINGGIIHILVHGALRPDAPWEALTWAQYAGALAELAVATPATVGYIDINPAFVAANITAGADPLDLMTDGGIHPNNSGQGLMATEVARLLGVPAPAPVPNIAIPYTPVLTAATTNPTLGTGGTAIGRYVQVGHLVTAWFTITFGTGLAAGAGGYRISIPGISAGGQQPGGAVKVQHGANAHLGLPMVFVTASTVAVQYCGTFGGAIGTVYDAGPFVWAAGDAITGFITYEVA